MANRDFTKSKKAAKRAGIPESSYTVIHCDLAALDSVRQFVTDFKQSGMPLDAMVANAAVYKPLLTEPERTAEGFELCVGTNHLGHFLLLNLLLEDLAASKNNPRLVPPLCTAVLDCGAFACIFDGGCPVFGSCLSGL